MKEMKQGNETENGTCGGCQNCGMGCSCGRMHGYSGHPILRILLALAIIGFVFTAGVKLGELKEQLGMGYEHGGYSEHRMMMDRGQDFQVYEGQGMPTVAPAAPAATTTAPANTTVSVPASR